MMRKRTVILAVVAIGLLVVGALRVGNVHAQTGGGYDLTWSTVDGGGYTFSTGGGYSLGGTIGQPDAGQSSGGGYGLAGGFWSGVGSSSIVYYVYLPCILRNSP